MKIALLAALLIATVGVASAQIGQNIGGGFDKFDGGISGVMQSKAGTPLTPCGDLTMDWSVATGCNLTAYLVNMR